MKNRLFIFAVLLSCAFLTQFTSCKKDSFLTDGGNLRFSKDTLYFDTVFTTLGTVTHSFKIFNTNDKPIKINNIRLEKGSSSFFRLNVDGVATKNIADIEVAANDSVYVFAALTVDPNSDASPFVINDKVLIKLNDGNFNVPLQAYGQNAHILRDSVLQSQTWLNDLPYVIINSALVDSGQILTIQKGCRIYMHLNSKLYVGGRLNCFGTLTDSIIFQGDRLDRNYFGQDFPGEWRGLHFLGSGSGSNLNHTIIKNAGASDAAVYVQPSNTNLPSNAYMLEMNKCVVANSLSFGILGFNTSINLNNCLVHSCGQQNFAALEGGKYNFNYCTFATYSGNGISHINQPTMALLNYYDKSPTEYTEGNLNANLTNCIIYGNLETELLLANKGNGQFNLNLTNCIIKRKDPIPTGMGNVNNLLNQDPLFVDYADWDYSVSTSSPAKNNGVSIMSVIDDILDQSRSATPTIGCYE